MFLVVIFERNKALLTTFIRLCGIVGGILTTSGVISQAIGAILDFICCRKDNNSHNEINSSSGSYSQILRPDMPIAEPARPTNMAPGQLVENDPAKMAAPASLLVDSNSISIPNTNFKLGHHL